jgi:hypothetical protein
MPASADSSLQVSEAVLTQAPDSPRSLNDDREMAQDIDMTDTKFDRASIDVEEISTEDGGDRPDRLTIDLAARDVRLVLEEQREQSQSLTTKLNILFVANGALLTSLSISRLMAIPSIFSFCEVVAFLVSFTLLVRAFLPRQVAVSPNLEDRKFLEKYLAMSAEDYQLQMLVNLAETYNANKQRLDDVSQTLRYAAYATWLIAAVMLVHMIAIYFIC